MRWTPMVLLACLGVVQVACAQEGLLGPSAAPPGPPPARMSPPAATQPANGIGKFPSLTVDVKKKQIRMDCQALAVEMPLEFFVVVNGTNEHESVLRSAAKPSDLHTALLMLGLKPGSPVTYSEATKKWLPPHGPPLNLSVEFQKNGKTVHLPANRLMRSTKDKKEAPAMTWIFAGSRVMEDGSYAADVTGYLVSVVNFDLTCIDVPQLASNANETLEWETNLPLMPALGSPVTLIIEPTGNQETPETSGAGGDVKAPIDAILVTVGADGTVELARKPVPVEQLTERVKKMQESRPGVVRISAHPSAPAEAVKAVQAAITDAGTTYEMAAPSGPVTQASSTVRDDPVHLDDAQLQAVRERWDKSVKPHDMALREAAQAHYEIIAQLRRDQQKLIDEADRINRMIDELNADYQNMTTPRPEPVGP